MRVSLVKSNLITCQKRNPIIYGYMSFEMLFLGLPLSNAMEMLKSRLICLVRCDARVQISSVTLLDQREDGKDLFEYMNGLLRHLVELIDFR